MQFKPNIDCFQTNNYIVRNIFGNISGHKWRDWHWQLDNRLTDISRIMVESQSPKQTALLKTVTAQCPFCVTPYYLSLCDKNDPRDPIRRQFFPDRRELLNKSAAADPLGEKRHEPVPGLIHRYRNRVVVIVTSDCAVRCRHCTRKNTLSSFGADDIFQRLPRIVKYIRQRKEIREVIISGGDPLLLETAALDRIMGELRAIKNVEVLRIGTRAPVVLPMRLDAELCACLAGHRPIWINTQFNHPREITEESENACRRLQEAGLPVSSQTVLLRGVNNSFAVLSKLCNDLQRIMVRPYYLFQCDPVRGVSHFSTSPAEGVKLAARLRLCLGGLSVPLFVADIPGSRNKILLETGCGCHDSAAQLTHIFHERISACEICALTASSCSQSFGAAYNTPCSRLTLRRAESVILSKPRSVGRAEARRADIS